MISSTIDATEKLTRALLEFPSIEECHAVLRAGGVRIDAWSRRVFETLFFNIRYEYKSRVAIRRQSHLARPLQRIDRALNNLVQEFQNDACSLAAEMIGESGSIFYGVTVQDGVAALHDRTKAYYQIYHMSHKDLENWLFAELYHLYGILKDKRPGNSTRGPLYRFTMQAAELVGMNVTISPEAFRMRIKRLVEGQREEPDILVGIAANDSPMAKRLLLRDARPSSATRAKSWLPAPDPIQLFSFMKK